MVRLVGWRGLGITAAEESRIKETIERHMRRVLTLVENLEDVSISVKETSKGGSVHRYQVSVAVLADKHYHAQHIGWDLLKSVQRCFGAVENQIKAKHEVAREHLYGRSFEYPEPLLRL